jgi:hypothetical protein
MDVKRLPGPMALTSAAVLLLAWILTGMHALQAVTQERPGPAPTHLELFGVPLKGATRNQLREALKRHGMRATREDDRYWLDFYDATDVLEGASEFCAGYVSATGRFDFAQYEFPAFMDTRMVERVVKMVSTKYGAPPSIKGRYGLGEVLASWNLEGGMEIEVSRGWPDTTTYLTFIDTAADAEMRSEIDAEKAAQERKKAEGQSHAF